jgi:hypothetical protein
VCGSVVGVGQGDLRSSRVVAQDWMPGGASADWRGDWAILGVGERWRSG